MDKVCAYVAFICPIIGEAAALQGDVEGTMQALVVCMDAESVGDVGVTGVAGEVYSGTVCLFEVFQVREMAPAACN